MATDIIIQGVSVLLVIGILCAVIKKIGIASRWIPAISILIGVIIVCFGSAELSIGNILMGIVIGSSASGLYDTGKKTVLNK